MNYHDLKAPEMTNKGKIGKWYHGRFFEKPSAKKEGKEDRKEEKRKFFGNKREENESTIGDSSESHTDSN